jgi:hypothetical protein
LNTAGLTGGKTIYQRWAEKEPEMGTPQTKPKRLKLVIVLRQYVQVSRLSCRVYCITSWEGTVTN